MKKELLNNKVKTDKSEETRKAIGISRAEQENLERNLLYRMIMLFD